MVLRTFSKKNNNSNNKDENGYICIHVSLTSPANKHREIFLCHTDADKEFKLLINKKVFKVSNKHKEQVKVVSSM